MARRGSCESSPIARMIGTGRGSNGWRFAKVRPEYDINGDYPLDVGWGLVAALADATIGASPRAQARTFRAAMTSAGSSCPHRRQLNAACELRVRLSTRPKTRQGRLVLAGSTKTTRIPAFAGLQAMNWRK